MARFKVSDNMTIDHEETIYQENTRLKAENNALRGVWVNLAEGRKILGNMLKHFDLKSEEYNAIEGVCDTMDAAMEAYKPEWRKERYKQVLAMEDLLLMEKTKAEMALKNLLAIIHGDGGEYTKEHGLDKSVEDAHCVLGKLIQIKEKLPKTADGVPLVDGSTVYFQEINGTKILKGIASMVSVESECVDSSTNSWMPSTTHYLRVCYSTIKAAEAARNKNV